MSTASVVSRLLALVVVITMSLSSNVFAAIGEFGSSFEGKYNAGRHAIEHKDYKTAEDELLDALNCATSEEQALSALNILAELYEELGDLESEEQVVREKLLIVSKSAEFSPKRAADLLNKLGSVNCDMKRYQTAKRYFQLALGVLNDVAGAISPEVAVALNNIGWVEYNQTDYRAAQSQFHSSLKILAKTLGKKSVLYALTASNLGECYLSLHQTPSGLFWLRVSYQTLGAVLGRQNEVTSAVKDRFDSVQNQYQASLDQSTVKRGHKVLHGKILPAKQ